MTSIPLFVNGEGMRGGAVHHTIADHSFRGFVQTAARYRFSLSAAGFPRCGTSRTAGCTCRVSSTTCRWR